MKSSMSVLKLSIILALAGACTADVSAPAPELADEELEHATSVNELDGVWRTHCDTEVSSSLRRELGFCNGRARFVEYTYADAQCATLSSSIEYEAWADTPPQKMHRGERHLSNVLLAVTMTPLDERSAQLFSELASCDAYAWRVGDSREIMSCMDDARDARMDARYRIDGERLSFSFGSHHRALRAVADTVGQPATLSDATAMTYYRRQAPQGFCD